MNDIIWTNHALQRINDRKMTKGQVLETISSPDSELYNADGSKELARVFGTQKIHAITKINEEGELIILSCWINPPTPGSKDHRNKEYYKKQKRAKGFRKFWNTFLNQMGF